MNIIGITGGTGFVGRHLIHWLLNKGYHIIVFTRHPHRDSPDSRVHYALWDPARGQCEQNALKDLDAVIHLAGAGVADKRWTETRKKEIIESRVLGTRFLADQIQANAPRCRTFISASAIGYYGPDRAKHTAFRESDSYYPDFLGTTCYQWEQEALTLQVHCRTTILRIGIVLGRDGGAFPQLYRPLRLGIKPILGSGSQMTSWLHVNDLAGMIGFALENEGIQGIYNAVAPQPVSHRTLMNTIARVRNRVAIPLPVPAFILKLVLGAMSTEVLKSCKVSNEKIAEAGFHYAYPQLDGCIRQLLRGDQ